MSEQFTAAEIQQAGSEFRKPWAMMGGVLLAGGLSAAGLNDVATTLGLSAGDGALAGIGGLAVMAGILLMLFGVLDRTRFSQGKAVQPHPRLRLALFAMIGLTILLMLVSMIIPAGAAGTNVESDIAEVHAEPRVLQSPDGLCAVTVPAGWGTNAELAALDPPPAIHASDSAGNVAVLVRHEAKSDLRTMTHEEYTELTVKAMLASLTEVTQSIPTVRQLGQYTAAISEITGVEGDTRITYRLTTIDTPRRFFVIVGWSLPSQADAARTAIDGIVSSFQCLDESR